MAGKAHPGKPGRPGRPPSLSDHAKAEIGRRLAQGEIASDLAKEYHVSKTMISRQISQQVPIVREIAARIASAESDMAVLPNSQQVAIRTLADQMRGIQNNLAQAALNGSKTNKILSGIAVKQASQLDGDEPDTDKLKTIAQLSVTGNEASRVATTLITAAGRERKEAEGTLTLEDLLGS